MTIVHRCTPRERLKELASLADIIIAAAGKYDIDMSNECLYSFILTVNLNDSEPDMSLMIHIIHRSL